MLTPRRARHHSRPPELPIIYGPRAYSASLHAPCRRLYRHIDAPFRRGGAASRERHARSRACHEMPSSRVAHASHARRLPIYARRERSAYVEPRYSHSRYHFASPSAIMLIHYVNAADAAIEDFDKPAHTRHAWKPRSRRRCAEVDETATARPTTPRRGASIIYATQLIAAARAAILCRRMSFEYHEMAHGALLTWRCASRHFRLVALQC